MAGTHGVVPATAGPTAAAWCAARYRSYRARRQHIPTLRWAASQLSTTFHRGYGVVGKLTLVAVTASTDSRSR